MSQTILYIVVAIILFNYVLGLLLDYLNDKSWTPELPADLAPFYNAEKYQKALNYHHDQQRLGFLSETVNVIGLLAFLLLGGFSWWTEILSPHFQNKILLALVFFGTLGFITDLLNLPFSLYGTFVIEQKYGFNKTTPATYIKDKIKGYLLGAIVGGGLGYFILWLIMKLGPGFWIYAWITAAFFMVFLNMFYTSLIVPLFNKLSPLGEGSLRDKISKYAKGVHFPLTNIYVIDGSKRSSRANAFFSGFGSKKKVVLYDTLIEKHTEEELVAVLAHEVGHYKKKHIIKSMIASVLQVGFMLWLLSVFIFNEDLSKALGAQHWQLHINLIAFGILYEPVSLAIGVFMNMLSRKHEYEADAFAASTADKVAFKEALLKLSVDNLSNMKPHPAYVFFHYSHPPVLQRLKAMD